MRRGQRAVLPAPAGHLAVGLGVSGPPEGLQAGLGHVACTWWSCGHQDRAENTHQVILYTGLPPDSHHCPSLGKLKPQP